MKCIHGFPGNLSRIPRDLRTTVWKPLRYTIAVNISLIAVNAHFL